MSIALPAPVSFAATASDSDGTVAKVEFFHGNTKVGEDTSAPYSSNWTAGPGSYSLTAVAEDSGGARTTSQPVSVTVTNAPPTIAMTSPVNGTAFRVGDVVELAATAADSSGTVARVEFYQGNVLLAQDTVAPFTFSWTPAVGSFSLTAIAEDSYGARATSQPVSITVTSNAPPVVTLVSPANGESIPLPNPVNLAATASDADGTVSKVEFYQGAVKVGEVFAAPFTFFWAAAPGTYSITAVAQDNNNARTTSAPRTVTVTNRAPIVAITSPASGSS
jgi:chitodextrinase